MLPEDAPTKAFVGKEEGPSDRDFTIGICRNGETAYLLDRESRQGYLWTHSADTLPVWEASGPFRTLLHWWWRPLGFQIVHAAAVGSNGNGVLLVGKSGSGKSTTALACFRDGMDLVGEDYCLIHTHTSAEAMSLYSTGKLTSATRALFPQLEQMLSSNSDKSLLESGKMLYFLGPELQKRMVKKLNLRAILIPEVTRDQNASLILTSKGDGLRSLSPSTLLQGPLSDQKDLRHMVQLVEKLPVYRLRLGSDLQSAVTQIRGVLDHSFDAVDPANVSERSHIHETLLSDRL